MPLFGRSTPPLPAGPGRDAEIAPLPGLAEYAARVVAGFDHRFDARSGHPDFAARAVYPMIPVLMSRELLGGTQE